MVSCVEHDRGDGELVSGCGGYKQKEREKGCVLSVLYIYTIFTGISILHYHQDKRMYSVPWLPCKFASTLPIKSETFNYTQICPRGRLSRYVLLPQYIYFVTTANPYRQSKLGISEEIITSAEYVNI